VTWLNHVWHDSFICDTAHSCVTWLIHMQHDSFIGGMTQWNILWLITGCRKPTGCLQVIFRERATNYKALCEKEPLITGLFCGSYRSFFAKEPQITGLFCGKWPVKIRHSMGLRHPVVICNLKRQLLYSPFICDMTHSYTKMTHSYATWLIYMRHNSFTCAMTHSHLGTLEMLSPLLMTCLLRVRYDLFIYDVTDLHVTWLLHAKWLMHTCHDSFTAWNVENTAHHSHDLFICDMTHSYAMWLNYMWRDSFMRNDKSMCAMTHSHLETSKMLPRHSIKIGTCVWHKIYVKIYIYIHTHTWI